jgi:hypothetical protein
VEDNLYGKVMGLWVLITVGLSHPGIHIIGQITTVLSVVDTEMCVRYLDRLTMALALAPSAYRYGAYMVSSAYA